MEYYNVKIAEKYPVKKFPCNFAVTHDSCNAFLFFRSKFEKDETETSENNRFLNFTEIIKKIPFLTQNLEKYFSVNS